MSIDRTVGVYHVGVVRIVVPEAVGIVIDFAYYYYYCKIRSSVVSPSPIQQPTYSNKKKEKKKIPFKLAQRACNITF